MRELLRENYPSETSLWVRDLVCERWDDFTDDSGKCTDLAAADMAELERLLPTYSIVWVEDDRAPDGSRPSGLGEAHPPYVEVAELEDVSEDGGSVLRVGDCWRFELCGVGIRRDTARGRSAACQAAGAGSSK